MNIVKVPYNFEGITLSRLVDSLIKNSGDKIPSSVYFDFSSLGFIKPTGVVFLHNLVKWLHAKDCKVFLHRIDTPSAAVRYLDDSQFFHQMTGSPISQNSSVRSTTIPLISICHAESHAWIRSHLIPWLANAAGTNEASLYELQTCIQELFNNIKDHTRFDIGSIFVQYYPANRTMNIALSDFGVGIPTNIRKIYPDISDGQAIIKACEDGFTTSKRCNKRWGWPSLP